MGRKRVSISITIPKELDNGIESFIEVYNKRYPDNKTSKSEFLSVAGIKLLEAINKDVKDIPEDKEEIN